MALTSMPTGWPLVDWLAATVEFRISASNPIIHDLVCLVAFQVGVSCTTD